MFPVCGILKSEKEKNVRLYDSSWFDVKGICLFFFLSEGSLVFKLGRIGFFAPFVFSKLTSGIINKLCKEQPLIHRVW